jgi:hypothetical protein
MFRAGLLEAAGLLVALLGAPSLFAQCSGGSCAAAGGCASCSTAGGCAPCRGTCPPPVIHYYEGPPKLKFKKACPRPVCDPCTLEHYGYYQTCWAPWPFPPDWSHCPVPPPGAVLPLPAVPPFTPRTRLPDRVPGTGVPGTPRTPGRESPPAKKKSDSDLPAPKPLDDKPMVRLLD